MYQNEMTKVPERMSKFKQKSSVGFGQGCFAELRRKQRPYF
jgi:hypothetical protein